MNKNTRLLIVDGSHYLYRAYYGVPESAKLPSGLQVNAVYGFMAYLRKAVLVVKPSHLIVVFDSETGITSKVQENEFYKSNRNYQDTGMYKQLPLIKNILDRLAIFNTEASSCEADDYIGTLASAWSKKGSKVYIFSNDADFLQLLTGKIYIVKMGKKHPDIVTQDIFEKKFEFKNTFYIDYLCLRGDPSDNIKGIPGVGCKTAQKLISSYKTISNIYSSIESLPKRLQPLLITYRNVLENNRKILQINTAEHIPNKSIGEYLLKDVDKLNHSTNTLLKDVGINIK
ncbi:MAG: DNA polymerase I [uncultured bacterium]|nr:MAG: DNA polymerase I [uncultured bacterium]